MNDPIRVIDDPSRLPRPPASLIALLFLLSFGTGLVKVFLFTSANALFVTQVGADFLPLVYFGVAIGAPVVGAISLHWQRSARHEQTLTFSLGLILVTTIAFRLLLAAAPSSATVAALLVWYYVVNAMVAVLFWSLSSWVIDLRASKQIHGLVGSGTFVAGFLGGLSVRPLLALIDVDDLLWLTVAALVVCLGLTLRICRRFAPAAAPDDHVRPPTPEEMQSVRRFAGLDLMIVGLVAASFCFVDRLFLTQAEARFASADDLAAFLGEFSAAVELLSFAVQLGLTGRIFHRLGLGGTLMLMPAVLCGMSSLLLGFELFNGATGIGAGVLFWLFCGLKFCDLVFRKSINLSALQLLIQPLSLGTRERLRTWGQMIVMPLARGGAALAMIAFAQLGWLSATPLTLTIVVLSTAWLLAARSAAREYDRHCERARQPDVLPGEEPLPYDVLHSGDESRLSG